MDIRSGSNGSGLLGFQEVAGLEQDIVSSLFIERFWIGRPVPAESYLSRLPVVRQLRKSGGIRLDSQVTFFVGENGVGKSTLIEALAVAVGFNPEGGTINFNFSTQDSHSELYQYLKIVRGGKRPRTGFFLRAESFYNVATEVDRLEETPGPSLLASYGGVSLHHQSHGESFMALVENRFGGQGLYILDEPEAALSPMKQMQLLCEIDRLVKGGSQFIISTHSPILMTFPGAEVYQLSRQKIEKVDYRETEHFQLTKAFLNAPEKMLGYLLKDGESPSGR